MFDVVCIGSTTRDHFLEAEYPLIDWPQTPLKKALVFPFGEKLEVDSVYATIGGNAANASITFARQGFEATCVAKIGDDFFGRAVLDDLLREGVDINNLFKTRERGTALSTILLSRGERTILGYHGSSDMLSIEDLNFDALRAKWWYISLAGESYVMLPSLISFAKEYGIQVAFNPSGHHIKKDPQAILNAMPHIRFLSLNEGEAAELLGISFEDEATVFKELDRRMDGIVAVTNGPKGVTISDGKQVFRVGIFREKNVVDRTGAGDAFGSGFVAGLMREGDVSYAVRIASANATSVVEHVGATQGILTKEQFDSDPRWKNLDISVE